MPSLPLHHPLLSLIGLHFVFLHCRALMGRVKDALLVFGLILFLSAEEDFLRSVSATTLVTGTVFCDQCKDGERSLIDFPLSGAKVAVECGGADGALTAYGEDETNWSGSYSVFFEGSPDLSGCYARVVEAPPECGAAAGPARGLTILFRMFGQGMYVVGPLLTEPQEPTGSCPRAAAKPTLALPPPPSRPAPPPAPTDWRTHPLPPPRQIPLFEASACPFDKWMNPQYKCSWKVVSPDTRVVVAFGPVAAGRYGMDMTLWEGLQGRGDLYRTLLREGTAALLNSYNSFGFFYSTLSVIDLMNRALVGSQQEVLMAAMRFRRANSGDFGAGSVGCNLSPCNS
ncbi:hypothetical protein Cni_G14658 [Canna indica]|uniref:Uncharacterized protein n=1 Tax=Canna indica TaxID=4628 RepID=A0AAQ3KGP5_9LILI|nr:hypothetical protein Cni_G14658 [Canna indica]